MLNWTKADQSAAHLRGGDLGRVDRGAHRRRADTDAAEEPEDLEHDDVGGERRAEGAGQVQDADHEEDGLAPVAVGRLTGGQGAEDSAEKGDADGPTQVGVVEMEIGFQLLGRSGDDCCVKSEDQAADRGDQSASYHKWLHARHARAADRPSVYIVARNSRNHTIPIETTIGHVE